MGKQFKKIVKNEEFSLNNESIVNVDDLKQNIYDLVFFADQYEGVEVGQYKLIILFIKRKKKIE